MDAVQKANAGHPGTAMALAPLRLRDLQALPAVQPGRHRVAGPRPLRPQLRPRLRAAVLAAPPDRLRPQLEDLEQFRQWGSRTPGHPERGHTPGIEVTTGPLGQGFANAVGMAMAERFLAERFNRPGQEIVDHHVYAICSDGDMMEGISQEAASIAGQLRARQADRLLRRQPHHDRRHDLALLRRREPRAPPRRPTAGTCSASRTPRTSMRSRRRSPRRARKPSAPRSSRSARTSPIPAPHAVDTAKSHGVAAGRGRGAGDQAR